MKLIQFKCPHCGAELVVTPRFLIRNCKACGALLDPRDYLRGVDSAVLQERPAASPAKTRARKAAAKPPAPKTKEPSPAKKPVPSEKEKDKTVSRSGRYYEASVSSSVPNRAPEKQTGTSALFTPVGFRTRTPLKMIAAVLGYLMILLMMRYSLASGLLFLGMVPIWFNWAPLSRILPIWKIKNKFLRGLALCGASFAWLVLMAFLSEYLE